MDLKSVRRYLPKSFLGVVPLHSGMELILVFTVINKMSGVFGLLSLFTNHPITFLQWVYYFTNALFVILSLFCYRSLREFANDAIKNSPLNTDENLDRIKIIAIFVTFYMLDFFVGNGFMVYLANLWLAEEYMATSDSSSLSSASSTEKVKQDLIKRVSQTASLQSASEGYEVFVSVVSILITAAFRIYFISVALSYYLRLRKHVTRPSTGIGAKFVDFLDMLN